jgi:cyclic beta-1,2-glucan synthetase
MRIRPLSLQLKKSFFTIQNVHGMLSQQPQENLPPASAWILDNFYIIKREALHTLEGMRFLKIKKLPQKDGVPRNYLITKEAVKSGVFDRQAWKKLELTSYEIGTLPLFFTLAVLEKISSLCIELEKEVEKGHKIRQIYTEIEQDSVQIESLFVGKELDTGLISRLIWILKNQNHSKELDIFLDAAFAKRNINREELLNQERKKQVALQEKAGCLIRALREIAEIDSEELFCSLSRAEKLLNRDTVYLKMDLRSKQEYRRAVADIAYRTKRSEEEVAENALKLSEIFEGERESHIGYYLIGDGKDKLLFKLGTYKIAKKSQYKKELAYIICIIGCSVLASVILTMWLPIKLAIAAFLITLLPASDIILRLTYAILSKRTPIRFLPRLDLQCGVPDEAKTAIVIPALLISQKDTIHLAEQLETFYLRNQDDNLCYGILGDFKDSDKETEASDTEIQISLKKQIDTLNQNYGDRFFYLQRRRVYYQNDQRWMGWERKRGAVEEFVCHLKEKENGFSQISGSKPENIRYVITLDADTELHYDVAKELIGTIIHPLNRAKLEHGRVTQGYGLIQPRIDVDLNSSNQSLFSKLFAGLGGIDPYRSGSSNVYQDVFGEGIFIGKGIFDVDVYEAVLLGRIPDNMVLSHDLLEGSYLRTGFAGDIEFTDGYPAGYRAHTKRLHRWIRGDWQLLSWIGKTVPSKRGREKSPFSLITRWKIIDNLRRSLFPIALFFLFALALWERRIVWIGFGIVYFDTLAIFLDRVLHRSLLRKKIKKGVSLGQIPKQFFANTIEFLFLPYQAGFTLDAIVRTLWRIGISHKHRLEWVTSSDSDKRIKNGILQSYRVMWQTVAAGILFFLFGRWIVGIVWIISPAIEFAIGTKRRDRGYSLLEQDKEMLYTLARRIWSYYEDFVSEEEHFLPPDNVQLEPPNGVAHRTSPTNIGLLLMAYVIAWKLGYLTDTQLAVRMGQTLDSIDKLEKWKGHLYNWYDTKTLAPMPPAYVSTVDNGNYIGYVMAAKQALLEIAKQPHDEKRLFFGLCQTAKLEGISPPDTTDLLILADRLKNAHGIRTRSLVNMIQKQEESGQTASKLKKLSDRLENIIQTTDFSLLYDKKKKLFAIGYDAQEKKLTPNYYDLFASEARQMSFCAVAKGDVPKEHWFATGRSLVSAHGDYGLVSWTGTMFEYLMPALLIHSPKESLLAHTYQFIVDSQIAYAHRHKTPWGISESGIFTFDTNMNYQYQPMGVPYLALKRGQENDYVISPYSSIMALMVRPEKAIENIKQLERIAGGEYGLFEAVDYTPGRLAFGERCEVVKSYMVHHLGMSFLALYNVLSDNQMQKSFHRDPRIRAAEYLLEERSPENVKIEPTPITTQKKEDSPHLITYQRQTDASIQAHILSNGAYTLLMNDVGGGYSKCNGIDITHRSENPYEWSNGIYLKNEDTGSWAPIIGPCSFSYSSAVWERAEDGIKAKVTVCVPAGKSAEVRLVEVTNTTDAPCTASLTSYQEIILAPHNAYSMHPAFSKLFVRTQYDEKRNALIACRRPREAGEEENLAVHQVVSEKAMDAAVEYETDRSRFIGRNRSKYNPRAKEHALSGSTGAVIDPIFSLRIQIKLAPGETTQVGFVTAFSQNTDGLTKLSDYFSHMHNITASIESAFGLGLIEQKFLMLKEGQEKLFLSMLPFLLYHPYKNDTGRYLQNHQGQSALWAMGISGDLPIVLAEQIETEETIRTLLKCHAYYRVKDFKFDLVFLCTEQFKDEIANLVQNSSSRDLIGSFGGIFIVSSPSDEQSALLCKTARVTFSAQALPEQLEYPQMPHPDEGSVWGNSDEIDCPKLLFDNGTGGFFGEDYVIHLRDHKTTPVPWSNVIANPNFGCLTTESGGGYTWCQNSRENKLTLWSNDPVQDSPSETLYLKEGQKVWSPARSPIDDGGEYIAQHGFGYTTYRHSVDGILAEETVFVAVGDEVKLVLLTLHNTTQRERNISSVYYVKPILGTDKRYTDYVRTEYDGIIEMENLYNSDFPNRKAFLAASRPFSSVTSEDDTFRKNRSGVPYALQQNQLSGKMGTGYPICAAGKHDIVLKAGEKTELVYLFGEMEKESIPKYHTPEKARNELARVKTYWKELLGVIHIDTPDKAMNQMVNGWLLYQTISCRLFARSAFYQSGGAYGFRDQLQDSLALLMIKPEWTRARILDHAAHQFLEGDVQHWWHVVENETYDRGIRTRFSDDLLWLVYVLCEYLIVTEDDSVLDEQVEYIAGQALEEGTDELYFVPQGSGVYEDIYHHALRALDRACRFGAHGLALMGSGDWNDGMNTVGNQGKGESVWLSWFLCDILKKIIPVCKRRTDAKTAQRYQSIQTSLAAAINQNAWDGDWYLRAFFDDGTPLGTKMSKECTIDSIAQSWSVISGMGDGKKQMRAMKSLEEYLIDRETGIIKLLTPAFDTMNPSPGYIQGYLPGVRENGGQYTHAAVWAVMAFARLGDREKAKEYFDMINPINHARTDLEMMRYQAEPYVMAADVYSNPQHPGRGGWTWYTGTAGWFYRLAVEELLGIKKRGEFLEITPCVPKEWKTFSVCYRYGNSEYHLRFENPNGGHKCVMEENGQRIDKIPLVSDGHRHEITITLL